MQQEPSQHHWRIGVDTGGTFTDVVAVKSSSGEIIYHKVHSTPQTPEDAVISGVIAISERGDFALADVALVMHGSTVATNTVLMRAGARLAMVTTRGFRDVLQIRRQNRPELYNLRSRRPDGLIPRSHILEIDERILFDGTSLIRPTESECERIRDAVDQLNVDAIVVGLLNSFVNAEHECELGMRLRAAFPSTSVCLSHEIACSQGEYERFSTAILNGYVQPVVTGYLGQLEAKLKACGVGAPLFIMKSNGGVAATSVVAQRSVEMLLSGPAGGVVAGVALAREHSRSNIITADMGGTSFDVAVIHEGAAVYTQERAFAHQTIQLPMMDIETIGAGGGSIGWIDAGGALRVGPQSAGALPGPACYGRGGNRPTITDANLMLGRLAPQSRMAGGFELDVNASHRALQTIADPLELTVEEVAEGLLRVVNANMTNAIRKLTVERGHDPADFTLCPCGGAGPLHAAGLASEIGIKEIVIPVMPGVFSAFGLLLSELREEHQDSRLGLLSDMVDELPEIFEQLLEEPKSRLARSGVADAQIRESRRLRLRYLGQGHDLAINLAKDAMDRSAIEHNFHAAHRLAYGYDFAGESVEAVAAWVSATVHFPDVAASRWPTRMGSAPVEKRKVTFDGVQHMTPVYERIALGTGYKSIGPAIIEQPDTTVVIHPDQSFEVNDLGHISITTDARAS